MWGARTNSNSNKYLCWWSFENRWVDPWFPVLELSLVPDIIGGLKLFLAVIIVALKLQRFFWNRGFRALLGCDHLDLSLATKESSRWSSRALLGSDHLELSLVVIILSSPWLPRRALLGSDHLDLSLVGIILSSPWSRSSQTHLHVSCGGTLAAAVGRRSWLGRIWASSRFSPVLLPFQSSSASSSTPAQPPISPAGAAVVLPSTDPSRNSFLGFIWGC